MLRGAMGRGASWQPLCPAHPQKAPVVAFPKLFHTAGAVPPASTPTTPGFAVGNVEKPEH